MVHTTKAEVPRKFYYILCEPFPFIFKEIFLSTIFDEIMHNSMPFQIPPQKNINFAKMTQNYIALIQD